MDCYQILVTNAIGEFAAVFMDGVSSSILTVNTEAEGFVKYFL